MHQVHLEVSKGLAVVPLPLVLVGIQLAVFLRPLEGILTSICRQFYPPVLVEDQALVASFEWQTFAMLLINDTVSHLFSHPKLVHPRISDLEWLQPSMLIWRQERERERERSGNIFRRTNHIIAYLHSF